MGRYVWQRNRQGWSFGNDTLVGDEGNDSFDGFESGLNRIDSTAYAVDDVTNFDLVGSSAVISKYDVGRGTIQLDNINAVDIDEGDFILA